jgi:hypothetical protein
MPSGVPDPTTPSADLSEERARHAQLETFNLQRETAKGKHIPPTPRRFDGSRFEVQSSAFPSFLVFGVSPYASLP